MLIQVQPEDVPKMTILYIMDNLSEAEEVTVRLQLIAYLSAADPGYNYLPIGAQAKAIDQFYDRCMEMQMKDTMHRLLNLNLGPVKTNWDNVKVTVTCGSRSLERIYRAV